MLNKPSIQYIDIKIMNNISRKPLDWHPYKTARQSLNCSYKDIFIKVLTWTLLTKGFFYYRRLELITSVHKKMLKCRLCAAVFSVGKITKSLYVYIRHIFPPHSSWKGDRQTLTLQSGRGKYYTSIVWSILKYCLVNELFEKWRISPIPSSLVTWQVAGRLVISDGSLRRVPTWDPPL